MVLTALIAPLAGTASATHTTVDAEPEFDTNANNQQHTITVTTSTASEEVNFQITAGPNVTGNASDGECTTDAVAPFQCTFTYGDNIDGVGGETGTDTIRAWSDEEGGADNDAFDAGEPSDEVQKQWITSGTAAGAAGMTLDCEPDTDTNPVNQPHVITCTVTGPDSADPGVTRDPIQGVQVLSYRNVFGGGTNPFAGTQSCTTNASGQCTFTYNSGAAGDDAFFQHIDNDNNGSGSCGAEADCGEGVNEGVAGSTACIVNTDGAGNAPEPDGTDCVQKTWEARTATFLNIEPETDTNPNGSQHTMIATVRDQAGDPINGAIVDAEIIDGPNQGPANATADMTCTTTNAGPGGPGTCALTYQDAAAFSAGDATDTICGWIDANNNTTFNLTGTPADGGECDTETPGESQDSPLGGVDAFGNDDTDTVTKTWTQNQAVTGTVVDCSPETASNPLNASHTVTCTVTDAGGNASTVAQNVDVEATGVNDPDNGDTPQSPDFQCNTVADDPTTGTNEGGTCTFTHNPPGNATPGQTLYRAWIDVNNDQTFEGDANEGRCATGAGDEANTGCTTNTPGAAEPDNTDVVAKNWVGAPSSLIMTPDTDTAAVGTCNAFTITLTDQQGQPVGGQTIDVEQVHQSFGTATPNANLGFCDPDGGANTATGTDVNEAFGDDADQTPNNVSSNTGEGGNQNDADAGGETFATTNAAGQLTFGVTSTATGNVTVTAFFDANDNDDADPTDPQDASTKTWTAGGAAGVATVDCEPETDSNPEQTTHSFTCTARNAQSDPVPGVQIVFDVTAGPNSEEIGETNCDADPDTGGPQLTGNAGTATCAYTDAAGANSPLGEDTIVGYVNQGAPAGSGPGVQPGEPQDEIRKTWTAAPTGLAVELTCAGSSPTDDRDVGERGGNFNPAEPENAGADCTNPLSDTQEVFTATVTNPGTDAGPGDDTPQSGVQVNFLISNENPADITFTPAAGASGNGPVQCTTAANGQCSVTVTNPTPAAGDFVEVTANVFGQQTQGPIANVSDTARKQWAAAGGVQSIDVQPSADTNQTLSQHSVTATVTDLFGAPVANTAVSFTVTGRNNVTGNATTNAQGVATFNYTDSGNAAIGSTDTITGTAGGNSDTAKKDWRATVPPVERVEIDNGGDCNAPVEDFTHAEWESNTHNGGGNITNQVNTTHLVCATAFVTVNVDNSADNDGDPLDGAPITFTLSGPGFFTDVTGTQNLGTSITVPMGNGTRANNAADAQTLDRARVFVRSNTAGTTTVTATSGGRSDSGNKIWTSLPARTIDCTPNTASNPPGSTHNIQCTATDRQGNPVAGQQIVAQETGTGRFSASVSCDPVAGLPADTCVRTTNAQGVAEFQVTTTAQEQGTQSITATLGEDFGDPATGDNDGDECDRIAGNPAGAPAGQCTDAVGKTWTTAATTTIAPAGGFPVEITLQASKRTVRFGRQFNLTGSISPIEGNTPPACVNNRTVILERIVTGETTPEQIATTTTDANGVFTFTLEGDKNATYVARVEPIGPTGNETCDDAASGGEEVRVKKKVTLRSSKDKVRRGGVVRLRIIVAPCAGHQGDRATLWKAVSGTMARVGSKRTNDNCVATFFRKIRRASVFQGRSPKQDADHQAGRSTKRAIQIRRR